MADPFQASSRGYFQLQEDEVLLVEAPVAECRYSTIQLANPWMESLDYASHQASLNHATTHGDADNRVRYVISQRDPGVRNWLDAASHSEGSLFARWTYCARYPLGIAAPLIKLGDLDGHLPADTPGVSPAGRHQPALRRWFVATSACAPGGHNCWCNLGGSHKTSSGAQG